MNLSNKLQTIVIALLSFFVGVSFTFTSSWVPQEQYLSEVNSLTKKINSLYIVIEDQEKQLNYYHTTESKLIKLGASPSQAQAIIQASEVYNLDPKH